MTKALIAVAALGATLGVWHWRTRGGDDATIDATGKLAHNRLWIDHMPKHERDVVQVFALIDAESIGVFQATSFWRGAHELFKFEGHEDEVRIVYPQTGERAKAKVKAKKCSEQGFDYCLEIAGANRGVARYYSYEGWELDGHGALQRKVDELTLAAPRDVD